MELFPEFEMQDEARPSPLADRMRPRNLEDVLGHDPVLGENKPLRKLIQKNSNLSFILWGPPGSGKTSIARMAANLSNAEFFEISAVNAGVSDIRKVIALADKLWKNSRRRALLFIDEIHRFNKAQQDSILPYIENGSLRLIGSTTENPSFEVIPALRSRCQIFRLEYLSSSVIRQILDQAIADPVRGLGQWKPKFQEAALGLIVDYANGDARRALNALEAAADWARSEVGESAEIDAETVQGILQKSAVLYDKGGTEHYDHASAYQKSLRGSDPDAAIYWLAKMIAGGEDPRFIIRRLLVTAAEDVGNADPQAFLLAHAAAQAVEKLGWPEARIPLAQATIYVANAPKDNSAICAVDEALSDIQGKGLSFPVPEHLRDTHYQDAKKRYGYGKEYKYPHDYPGNYVEQEYLPNELKGRKYVSSKTQKEEKGSK
ncbi:MAG: replication-associated recombination protein A [Candidatus Nitrohelix vancouverensis]|uniref:Replication-associated recombination protein A n=1 Tax=Candidatus Nitrohelix vancouverensis TaxID=2705534 RepID=A0A7T0C3X3_9BACT|nr:MAG: replication-associated recombination protein A [Candidatus Nitrohelix vancouverensis]